MKRALVLGCGLIGKTIAIDLSEDFAVTVLDFSRQALDSLNDRPNIKKIEGSAADLNFLAGLIKDADIVCGVLPGSLDGPAKRLVIDLGVNYVSPSGFKNADGLDELAKKRGVTAVFDMGVSPGMSNYLVGRGAHLLDSLDEGIIYVCGIPQRLDPPFNYRTVFCLEDTLNEYIRPARYVDDWQVKVAPALSGLEEVDIPGIGKLEAFFTDGLRSAADNIKGRVVAEKTMRWPGYVDAINILKAAGLLDTDPIDIGGVKIVPRDFAAALLRPRWELRPEAGDRDYTVMRVITKGRKGTEQVTYTWNMVDGFDESTMIHSMARTTAYPCVATVRAIANGMIREHGFIAPELLVSDDKFYDFLIGEQKKHGIVYRESLEGKS
jgi:saccharopine dehydrogenase-like NADP-dependent oxidoreductase